MIHDRLAGSRSAGHVVAALALGLLLVNAAPQRSWPLDTTALERTEELSESLANDLLALSVAARDRNLIEVARYSSPDLVAGNWRGDPGPLVRVHEWLWRHDWDVEGPSAAPAPTTFAKALAATLGHFRSLDDVRFKVKGAEFADPESASGEARVQLQVHGRDHEGRREWLIAWLQVEAHRPTIDGNWRLDRVELESVESSVAEIDIFSEVALPAGLRLRFPDFGTPPNDSVIAHGAAVGDVNADGLQDLLTTGVEGNRLYLNDGVGGFRDVSEEALIALVPPGTGALFVDGDNDGDVDVFLAAVGRQMYLQNRLVPEGQLRFVDVSTRAGVDVPAIGFSAATADINGDGAPDIYVASYNRYGTVMPDHWHEATNGTPNLLFVNRGDGTFREEAADWNVRDGRWSYAAAFADVDMDGDQDLYVANDFGRNNLYRNDGGRFTDMAEAAGVEDVGSGMSVAWSDYNQDGWMDLYVGNMFSAAGSRITFQRRFNPSLTDEAIASLRRLARGNTLFAGAAGGTMRDVSFEAGVTMGRWAWSSNFVDINNDGRDDIVVANGFVTGTNDDDL